MKSTILSLLLVSFCLSLPAASQFCIESACPAYVDLIYSCNSSSAGNVETFESCICKNASQYQTEAETCYKCVQTGGNQTFINAVGELLNLCAAAPLTPTATPTSVQTINIIGTSTSASTSNSPIATSSGSKLEREFWSYSLSIWGIVWGLRELW